MDLVKYHQIVDKYAYIDVRPTPYKISTITATGNTGCDVSLLDVFNLIPLERPSSALGDRTWGFMSAQFVIDGTLVRRTAIDENGKPMPIQTSSRRKRRQPRHFDNQCTLIYWEDTRIHVGITRGVNIKVFRNGRLQMTGIRTIEEGARIVDRICSSFTENSIGDVGLQSGTSDYKICLMNSDFHLNFGLHRDVLYNKYREMGLVCSYEACIYPAVKLSFMWNHGKTAKNQAQDGICSCPEHCGGDGDGYGRCRKVTCAIFQSGSVIITGAHDHTQITHAYAFLCSTIVNSMDAVRKV
jgi:TATA-box binding protein (TBP) (component of TFIID and TFIIIB)